MRTVAAILKGLEALPATEPETMLAGRRPLILAPHPDDESLGCGGLIAAACAAGLAPAVAIMTDGTASHPGSATFPQSRLRAVREAEARSALRILGLPGGHCLFMRHPDTALSPTGAALGSALAFGRAQNCGLVIGPWAGDPHCDHEAAAVIAAAIAAQSGWPLLSYPLWGWLRDRAGAFDEPRQGGYRVNIASHLPRKQRAIAAHRSQYGDLIADSEPGFCLPAALLAIVARPYEVFIA